RACGRGGSPCKREADQRGPPPLRSLSADLGLERIDIVGSHFTDGRYLAALDPPQAEGPGDVAVLIESDGTDYALIFDRLSLLEEVERLGKFILAGMDDFAARCHHFADGILD